MTGADWLSSVFPETDQRRFCRRRKPLLRLSMADFSSSKTLLRLHMAPKAENAWYKRWNSVTHTRHTAEKVPYISHLVKNNSSNLPQISRIDILAETFLPIYDAPLFTTAISKARFPRHARMEYASARNTHGMHLFRTTAALFFAPMHFCYGS